MHSNYHKEQNCAVNSSTITILFSLSIFSTVHSTGLTKCIQMATVFVFCSSLPTSQWSHLTLKKVVDETEIKYNTCISPFKTFSTSEFGCCHCTQSQLVLHPQNLNNLLKHPIKPILCKKIVNHAPQNVS